MKYSALVALVYIVFVTDVRGQQFIDATHLLKSPSEDGRVVTGASAADVNSDGLVDLFYVGGLLIQQHDGTFVDMLRGSRIINGIGDVQGGVFADLDGDGFADLYTTNLTERSLLYHNQTDGTFRPLANGPSVQFGTVSPLWADLDDDGRLDIFTTVETRRNFLFTQLALTDSVPSVVFEERTRAFNLVVSKKPCGATVSDYDQDGDQDLFIASCDTSSTLAGADMLFRNEREDRFTDIGESGGLPRNYRYSRGALWLDVNNDGWQDLFILNHVLDPLKSLVTGTDALHINRNGVFESAARAWGVEGGSVEQGYSAGSADFDNDGRIDLLVLNWPGVNFRGPRENHLFHNEGERFEDVWEDSISKSLSSELPEQVVCALADFNNDGWIDIFFISRHGNRLLLNAGGNNHWLKVSLRGTSGNHQGVGARIEVHQNGGIQVREITAGEGYATQHHNLTAHFGLGAERGIDSLIVHWPGGNVDRLLDPSVDAWITIVEGLGVNNPPSTPMLEHPHDDVVIPFEQSAVEFSWLSSVRDDADRYTLRVRGQGLDTTLTGLVEPRASLPTDLLEQREQYTWMVFSTDGYTVRRSTDTRSFSYAGLQRFPVAEGNMGLPHATLGGISFADFDGDDDLDLVLAGRGADGPILAVYETQDLFYEQGMVLGQYKGFVLAAELLPLELGSVLWSDYDVDGDPDIISMGLVIDNGDTTAATIFYRNEGGTFTRDNSIDLTGLVWGEAVPGDYDADGDPDLLVTGSRSSEPPFEPVTELFRNDSGVFNRMNVSIEPLHRSSATWGDYDADGDLDLFVMGDRSEGTFYSAIYRNNGSDHFGVAQELPGLAHGSGSWADMDGDGDLDLLVSGSRLGPELLSGVTRIYRNDNGMFMHLPQHRDFAQLGLGEARWADFEGDGDPDILLVGAETPYTAPRLVTYRNEGGRFARETDIHGLFFSSAVVADYNLDGDADIVIIGQTADGQPWTRVLLNQRIPEFYPP